MFKARQRVLLCYFILSIWIFMIIAGMYKYMGSGDILPGGSLIFIDNDVDDLTGIKQSKYIFKSCNPLNAIVADGEGGVYDDFLLKGVIVLTRHGDRGPLSHVHSIESVDCGIQDPMLTKYMSFLTNWTHTVWTQPGSFHGFPLLPSSTTACQLGQLTYKGIAQLLKLGQILHSAYSKQLSLPQLKSSDKTVTNPDNKVPAEALSASDILVVSTKYRRTFQSAMALMFNIIPSHLWTQLDVEESLSLSFCFNDCACAASEVYKRALSAQVNRNFQRHHDIQKIVQSLSNSLMESKDASAPDVRDALLSFLCHEASLPCRKYPDNTWDALKLSYQRSLQAASDPKSYNYIINIDQDDKSKDPTAYEDLVDVYNNNYENVDSEKCIDREYVSSLFTYLYKDKKQQLQSSNNRIMSILKAYGLIKNIVQKMLSIVSNRKPKFILHSGHDKTLQYLATTLGFGEDIPFIPYASRVIFEIYTKKYFDANSYSNVLANEFYFRVLFNGIDVTRKLVFCKGERSLQNMSYDSKDGGRRRHQSYFCPIEYIVRFIHDDYFLSLNATNFKDACMTHL